MQTHLAQTSCEDYNFVYFAHLLQKIVDTWSLYDIHIMPLKFNFDRDDIISLGYRL